MIFPSFVAIRNGDNFVTCVPEGERKGFLELNPKAEVPSLIARFVVESSGESDYVHIRSCYNNKYLLCRTSTSEDYIVAGGDNPVKDKRAKDCTLFRVEPWKSQNVFGDSLIAQVPSGRAWHNTYIDGNRYLVLSFSSKLGLIFNIVRYDELIRLPKRVIFKGDNGKYLRHRRTAPDPIPPPVVMMWTVGELKYESYNEFSSKDGSERLAQYEITQYNGFVRVKSLETGKFWRRHSENNHYDRWIRSDSNDSTINDRDTLFKVENLGNNVIALRNIGDNKVCTRKTLKGLYNCLRAEETYVVPAARLSVEEPLSYMKIEAQYKLEDAKITSRDLRQLKCVTHINDSKDRSDVLKKVFDCQEHRTTSWNSTTTVTKSFNAKLNVPIPRFIKGELVVSGQTVDVSELEKGSIFSIKDTAEVRIDVPPMCKGTIWQYVHEVTYDIPFSYVKFRKYNTGEERVTVEEGGVCRGIEGHNIDFKKKIEKLY